MTPEQQYHSYCQAFTGRELPLAYVDLELWQQNIEQVLQRSGRKLIRIATKSVRSVPMLRRLLQASPRFQGLMCYTAPEAVWLAGQGFTDLLVAYPTWEPAHLQAVAQATAAGHLITLMVDGEEQVVQVEQYAKAAGVKIPLCLDLDLSSDFGPLHFGVWRSKINTPAQAVALGQRITQSPHLQLEGLMGYEAQIAGLGNANRHKKMMSLAISWLQKFSLKELVKRRTAVLEALQQAGLTLRFVNGGGTGSLHTTSQEPLVTEVTAGSAFYAPLLFDHYRDFRPQPAAGYALRIVRQPRPGIFTCLGGGYVASGQTEPSKSPQPYLPAGAKLDSNEGAGEVQTPILYNGHLALKIGDPIFMRHSKAGELCEHFQQLHLVQNGRVVEVVNSYRGDGQCFL